MTVFTPRRLDLSIRLREEEVLHFLGYPAGRRVGARVASRMRSLLPEARAQVAARGCFVLCPPGRAARVGLRPRAARHLALGLVTAGAGIETMARSRQDQGDLTAALILEACGSAAAEEAADALGTVIAAESRTPIAGTEAVSPACRISPGYGEWPLEAQRMIFDLLPHREIGVELLPSMLMLPRKSISFAMWLGGPPDGSGAPCVVCGLPNCRYRRTPAGDPAPSPDDSP